jgi:hypothetical protein
MMTDDATIKLKRSVPLTQDQVNDIIERIKKYPTKTDAAIALGVSREVMVRVIMYSSCAEKTLYKLFPKELKNHSKKRRLGVVTTKLTIQNKKIS